MWNKYLVPGKYIKFAQNLIKLLARLDDFYKNEVWEIGRTKQLPSLPHSLSLFGKLQLCRFSIMPIHFR